MLLDMLYDKKKSKVYEVDLFKKLGIETEYPNFHCFSRKERNLIHSIYRIRNFISDRLKYQYSEEVIKLVEKSCNDIKEKYNVELIFKPYNIFDIEMDIINHNEWKIK